MHHPPGQMSSELGFLPSMYPFPCLGSMAHTSGPSMYPFPCPSSMAQTSGFNISSAGSPHLLPQTPANTSWERRCLRKHRTRSDDEACSAKRRRLMLTSDPGDSSSMCHSWSPGSPGPTCPLPSPPSPALAPAAPPPLLLQGLAGPPRPLPRHEADCLHMEVEAAQRRLQEIEERITLEDDEEDDLDVASMPRRPVLVMSDSLKEGLQRGITDILPHTVAQSVSHSCMELVVWRPPEDALSRKFRGSLQRQRKQQQQQAASRPPPAPSPPGPLPPPGPLGGIPGEEDMEL